MNRLFVLITLGLFVTLGSDVLLTKALASPEASLTSAQFSDALVLGQNSRLGQSSSSSSSSSSESSYRGGRGIGRLIKFVVLGIGGGVIWLVKWSLFDD